MNAKPFIHPDVLRVGDRVVISGFVDTISGEQEVPRRYGVVTAIYPHFWNIKFDRGYTESWSFYNLLRSLNGMPPGASYLYRPEEAYGVARLK